MEGTEGAFTCSTCRLRWPTVEAQRKHCQTPLHAFNVRRKVVNMVPVTPAQYAEHTEHAEHAARGGDGSTKAAPKEETTLHCTACRKSYASRCTMDQHLRSKKHVAAAKGRSDEELVETRAASKKEDPEAAASAELDEDALIEAKLRKGRRLGALECAFCGDTSATTPEENAEHALASHGFFVPDVEYLVDLEGLLAYVGDKVGVGFACVLCHRVFGSLDACRKHMADMAHCMMAYGEDDTDGEWDPFYDYSSEPASELVVTPDGNQLMVGDTGKVLGHRDFAVYYAQRLPSRADPASPDQQLTKAERARRLKTYYHKMLGDGLGRGPSGETREAKAARAYAHKMQRVKDLKTSEATTLVNGRYFRRRDLTW